VEIMRDHFGSDRVIAQTLCVCRLANTG
jgi:hypothetical protein